MTIWKTKNGKEIPISKLSDLHILNILRVLQKKAERKRVEKLTDTDLEALFTFTWRNFVDDLFSKIECEATNRNLDTHFLLTEKVVLDSYRGSLESQIVAALRNTIKAHGNITVDNAPSAAKRIIGVIKIHNRKIANAD